MAGPVQSVPFTGTSSPLTVTISATGTGNCLVVFFGAADTVTAPTVSGITLGGAAGNFAQAAGAGGGTHIDAEIWTDRNAASGQTSVVISWSGGVSTTVAGRIEEWPGIVTAVSPVDKTSTGTGTTATSWSSGATGPLTQAAEIVTGMVANTSGLSTSITGPSSPWTNQAEVDSATAIGEMNGWQQVAATTSQTYSGTFANLTSYSAVVVSLLQSAAAPSGTVQPAATVPPRRARPGRAIARGISGTLPAAAARIMASGWLVGRTRHSDAVWGGIASSLVAAPPGPGGVPVSGWLVGRTRHSDAVWGGVTSSAVPVPGVAVAAPRQLATIPRRRLARAYIRFTPVPGSNVPAVILPLVQTASYDGKTWLKKQWILGV
jgi:hypothetical protein